MESAEGAGKEEPRRMRRFDKMKNRAETGRIAGRAGQ